MPILNYTTSINPEKTAANIQIMLAKAGAQAVLCEYDEDGIMNSISFRIKTGNGFISYKLPSRTDGVHKRLQTAKTSKGKKISEKFKTHQQASRIAWRILKDWIEAQLAMIDIEMVDLKEVFLPYAQNKEGQTLYEHLEATQYKMLTE